MLFERVKQLSYSDLHCQSEPVEGLEMLYNLEATQLRPYELHNLETLVFH